MAPTNKSRALYRGLLIPDGDISELWGLESTIDEAGERAGIPVPTVQTEALLESSGNQLDTGADRSLEVRTLRGGYPGPYQAGFGWRKTEGVTEDFRGWDPPLTVSQLEVVEAQTSNKSYLHMHLVSKIHEDGSDQLFCFHEFVSGVYPTANLRTFVTRRDDSGWLTSGAWPVSIATANQPYDALNMHPTGVVLPSGRLLCFFFVYSTEVFIGGVYQNIFANVRMEYSDDNGETWKLGSRFCLQERVKVPPSAATPGDADSVIPHRMKAEYKDGQILLLIWYRLNPLLTKQDGIRQYASDDLGTSFQFVGESFGKTPDVEPFCQDITVGGGNFVVGWIDHTDDSVHVDVIGSAYEPINWQIARLPVSTAPACRTTQTAWPDWRGIEEDGDLAIVTDADGTIYLYSFAFPFSSGSILDSSSGVVFKSLEGGALDTWFGVGHGFGSGTDVTYGYNMGTFWKSRTNDSEANYIKPVNITAAPHRGRIALAHRGHGGTAGQQQEELETPYPGTFFVFWLGGFTQVVEPTLGAFSRSDFRSCFSSTWFPYTEPATSVGGIWTLVSVAPPPLAALVVASRYELTTPPASLFYFQDTQPSSGLPSESRVEFLEGFIGRFTCEVISDPSEQRINALIAEGGGGGIEVSIVIDAVQVSILDNITGATLGTFTPGGMVGVRYQYLWAFRGTGDPPSGGEFSIWYRVWNANEDRTWTLGFESSTFVLGAAPADSRIQWGAVGGFGGAPTLGSAFLWDEFQFTYGEIEDGAGSRFPNVGLQIAQGQTTPDDLYGRSYAPTPVYVDANTRIANIDGPTFEGDTWDIKARHLLGSENMITENSPSPSIVWRSKTASAGDIIAFRRNPDAVGAFPGNDLYAVHFENCNFKRAAIEIKVGGVWTPLGTLELSRNFSFQREGHTIRANPSGGSIDGFYVEYNELENCKFEFNPDDQNAMVATIERNSEGVGYDMPTIPEQTKRATIFLDPDTYDEAAAPVSGIGAVWFKNVTALINLPVQSPFEGIRVVLCPTGTLPPEGHYVAGNIIPGPVAVFGWDYSRERIVNREANTELITSRDGSRRAYVAGGTVRGVRFSWREGVDVTELREDYNATSTEGYVKTWNSPTSSPVAMRQDGPLLMDGLVERLNGAAIPIVYIPRIERSDDVMLFDPRQFNRGAIYGRIVSAHTREAVVGAEEVSSVYRVNTVTIEGER